MRAIPGVVVVKESHHYSLPLITIFTVPIAPQYHLVRVSAIDLSDNRYTLNPFASQEPNDELAKSIHSVGMLHPPLLLEIQKKRFIVLSGRKRVPIAARHIDTPLTALIIPYQKNSVKQELLIFTILLQHQLTSSSLSAIEQATFFKKTLACIPAEKVITLLPMLGYKPKPHIPPQLISLLDLDLSTQHGIHRGTLSLRAGKKLAQFSHEDQQALVALIEELQLGGSKQQQFIDAVNELTKRLRLNAEELLKRWREQEKRKDNQTNAPQKATSLLNWLRQECRPSLAAEKKNFIAFQRELNLPKGVRLNHTLSFENDQVSLSINFNSKKQLWEKWQEIKSLIEEQDL